MSSSDNFAKWIARRTDIDPNGMFDVIAHGTPDGIEIIRKGTKITVNSRTAARLIEQLPGYHGQDIRLLSCSTGARADGFAQNLANKLGVKVTAPTDTLWANKYGRYFVAAKNAQGHADMAKRGTFKTYIPGGNKR